MTELIRTIEDCLELLSGLKGSVNIQIEPSDYTILTSISKQAFKGLGLTDKQYQLCKDKLLTTYADQFLELGYDITESVEQLRMPIRQIDRRKYISIVSDTEKTENYINDNLLWFCVRFPFSKKMIVDIERCITNRRTYIHNKGSHKHFFVVNETNVHTVINTFKDRGFDIDEELITFYNQIEEIKSKPLSFLPSIENYQLLNVSDKIKSLAENEIGSLSKNTILYYLDRRFRYGIVNINYNINPTSLAETIALREKTEFLSKPSEMNLDTVLGAINTLQRYPLLVVVDDSHAESQVYETFNYFRHIVSPKEQSILFRLDNDTGLSFNEYIRENNLNNWVDKDTKIVYINNSKLPKLLVSGEWRPIAALVFGSFPTRLNEAYLKTYCDLVVYRDESMSPFKRIIR